MLIMMMIMMMMTAEFTVGSPGLWRWGISGLRGRDGHASMCMGDSRPMLTLVLSREVKAGTGDAQS